MPNNKPLVSVIIPCYNAEKYVEQAVRSIMNQTYKNLEIIIGNDCSTDSSLEIIKKLAIEDDRIRIINNSENLKIVKTLNKLVEISNGKYIARMDADDISLPKRIEKQVLFMEKHSEYAICGTNAYIIDKENRIDGISYIPCSNNNIKKYLILGSPFYHPSVMVKSEILKSFKYDLNFLYAEDYELWVRILLNSKGYNLRKKLFAYRVFNEQTSSKRITEQLVSTKNIFYKNKYLLPEELFDFFFSFRFNNLLNNDDYFTLKKCFKNGFPNDSIMLFQMIKKTTNNKFVIFRIFFNSFLSIITYVVSKIYVKIIGKYKVQKLWKNSSQ